MKSPFPGMDPYLEKHWGDVHHRLVTYASDQLQPRLPADLRARVEERVFVAWKGMEQRGIYPDVHVVEHRKPATAEGGEATGLAVAEPLVIHAVDEPVTEGYIEIIDAGSGNRVVTMIEFLSPTNKVPGDGRDQYVRKQREGRAAGVSLVEVDLTRAGKRTSFLPLDRIPVSHRTTYQVWVRRGWEIAQFEVYRAPLRERLPVIRIPLRQTDQDAPLDLQALVDQCYQNGRYDDLDYKSAVDPPLDPSEAAWADELLQTKGMR